MNCASIIGLRKLENRKDVDDPLLCESQFFTLFLPSTIILLFVSSHKHLSTSKRFHLNLSTHWRVKKRLTHLYFSQLFLPYLFVFMRFWSNIDGRKKSFTAQWLNDLVYFSHDLVQVRKVAYVKGNSVPHANLEVLDKLVATRHEFAQVCVWTLLVWQSDWFLLDCVSSN